MPSQKFCCSVLDQVINLWGCLNHKYPQRVESVNRRLNHWNAGVSVCVCVSVCTMVWASCVCGSQCAKVHVRECIVKLGSQWVYGGGTHRLEGSCSGWWGFRPGECPRVRSLCSWNLSGCRTCLHASFECCFAVSVETADCLAEAQGCSQCCYLSYKGTASQSCLWRPLYECL